MSKELAQQINNEIRNYCYLSSAVKETTYCWALENRRDLIDAANEIVDLLEKEIQRKGEQLESLMESIGITLADLSNEEYFDDLA